MSQKKYVNEINLQTAMTEYQEDLNKGIKVRTQYGDEVGTVSQVYDNEHGSGEQVYAVVDNPKQDPEEVTQVTVLFRGSTGVDNWTFSLAKEARKTNQDIFNDWVRTDAQMAYNIITMGEEVRKAKNYITSGGVDNQVGADVAQQQKDASKAFNAILEKYPNAKIKVYGHSLGSMNIQYALANMPKEEAHRIVGGWVYNGPNIYSELTAEQKKMMDETLKGKLQIYYDPKDIVGLAYVDDEGNFLPAAGTVHQVASKDVDTGKGEQHMTYGYQLDKQGKIKITNTNPQTASLSTVVSGMSDISSIRGDFLASGGRVSKSEAFFLDSEQAKLIGDGLSVAANTGRDSMVASRNQALEELEHIYSSLSHVPTGFILTPEEVLGAYAEAGADYTTIVANVISTLDTKVAMAESLSTSFSTLQSEINTGIEEAVTADANLASKIQTWTEDYLK